MSLSQSDTNKTLKEDVMKVLDVKNSVDIMVLSILGSLCVVSFLV